MAFFEGVESSDPARAKLSQNRRQKRQEMSVFTHCDFVGPAMNFVRFPTEKKGRKRRAIQFTPLDLSGVKEVSRNTVSPPHSVARPTPMFAFFRTSSKALNGFSQSRRRTMPSIPTSVREDVLPVEIYGPFETIGAKR